MRALIFDLDGTLVDSVYAHALAWQRAFAEQGLSIDAWRLHRRIGMSGDVLVRSICDEMGCSMPDLGAISQREAKLFLKILPDPAPQRGAKQLLARLRKLNVHFGIASSGARKDLQRSLDVLGIRKSDVVVTRDEVEAGKPHGDLFEECIERLQVPASDCFAVGDSIWDALSARRARILFVGLLSGGYGRDELTEAGAYRVYDDTALLVRNLSELGLTV